MAFTDALSVAGKMIGLASDIYMGHGGKYDKGNTNATPVNKNTSQGQNMDDNKHWLNIGTPEFETVAKFVDKYPADELIRKARTKYKVSKEVEQSIINLYN